MIKIDNLNYAFNQKKILDGICLTIKRGELVGIIGANGSGKTTLLKCISGIYKTDHCVLLDDKPIEKYAIKARAKKIAMMHQSEFVNFDFASRQVVALGRYAYLKPFSRPSKQDDLVIEKTMQLTNTTPFKKRSILRLSGGEHQRVRFAKSLVQQTPFLLLDEATAALDIKYESEIFNLAQVMNQKNIAVVMTIHNIKMAIKYCPRLILLKEGKIIADGNVEQVITEANLKSAYGVSTQIYYNQMAKHIDFVLQ